MSFSWSSFRLAHIMFGRDVIEVATFRANHSDARSENQAKQSDEGMLLRDNVYGTIEQDAERRDFTVNAFTTIRKIIRCVITSTELMT